jgi:hypothetical protein
MLATSTPRCGVYLSFGHDIAVHARRIFPPSVQCRTAHSFAYRAVGHRYDARLHGPRLPARAVAERLGLAPVQITPDLWLTPTQLARLAMETVTRFCHSAEPDLKRWHVPATPRFEAAQAHADLINIVIPLAHRVWEDIQALDGRLRVEHDHYLKLWQLTGPQLDADFVMLDEAQDADPVIEDVVRRQAAQRVLVGDDAQAIYAWRGAVDALARFDGVRLPLSQSFRFGPAIADEANRWLTCLAATPWLRGTPSIPSVIGPVACPSVILCRTNAGVITEAMAAQAEGRAVGVVGGHRAIRRLAEAALTLQAEIGTDHPELYMFRTWRELQEYVELDVAGADLKVFVALIDRYGADEILRFTDRLVSATKAEVLISTAHKAKGLEWPRVRISTDFPGPQSATPSGDADADEDARGPTRDTLFSRAEARLAYVGVTRAQHVLDPGGLTWIRNWMGA